MNNNFIQYDLKNFKDYNLTQLNKHLNKIVRVDFSCVPATDESRQIAHFYREAKGVYKITDLTDNRIYVGSAGSNGGLIKRLKRHLNDLKRGDHFNTHLQRCYNKHGLAKFDFQVIEFYEWKSELTIEQNKHNIELREQYYIDTMGARGKNTGFNQADHAHGGFNDVTWETLESRTNITVKQLKEIIELLNTSMLCRDIDNKVGVRKGTALLFYKGQILSKIRENCNIKARDTSQKGENSINVKLTERQVKEIIEELKIGTSIPCLAKKYGVDKASIHDIKNGRNWAHLTKRIKFYDYPKTKKDEELPPVYQYSLDGSYQKEWANYREAGRNYGLLTSSVNEGIKNDALYICNHLWSYEKKEHITPKAPIELFFYYNKNGKEDAFFEVNEGKPCECCAMVFTPLVLFDLKEGKYLWAWKTKSELAKKVTGKAKVHLFNMYNIYQNRYKLLPMRDIPKKDLPKIKDLLESGKEMDYSILGYTDNVPRSQYKFPILPENQIDYTQNNPNFNLKV